MKHLVTDEGLVNKKAPLVAHTVKQRRGGICCIYFSMPMRNCHKILLSLT
jgi:hypothetical protein